MRRYSIYLVLLLFVCVAMVLLFNASSCYALSYEEIQTYVNNTADYYPNNSNYQVIKSAINHQNFKSYLENNLSILSNYSNCYLYYVHGSNWGLVYLYIYNGSNYKINTNDIGFNGNYRVLNFDVRSNSLNSYFSGNQPISNNSIILDRCCSGNPNYYNSLEGMNYTSDYIEDQYEMMATYVGNQAMPQWIYLEFNNSMIENTAYNGSIFTYYFKGNLYSQNQRKIGQIIPNDSYYYECRLYDYSQNIYIGTSFISLNVNPPIFYNDGAIYINDNQEVFVNTINLDYSTQYRLDIVSYYGDGGSNLYEDDEWFIFLPLNASVSGDIILNVGSGDFTNQDSTMQLINSITEFTPFTNSGDIINNIDIVPIYTYSSGDSISTFFVDVLQHISDVFLLDDEVTLHLVLPIFSHEKNIRSDFWITHDYLPQLAEFINGAWWLIICLGMLYKIDVLVELYNFGDFITASYYIYQTRRLL